MNLYTIGFVISISLFEMSMSENALSSRPSGNFPKNSVESCLRALKQAMQSCHSRVTILFLAACPDNIERIRSHKEQRAIEDTLKKSTFTEGYRLYDVKSCKLRDITAALRKYKPTNLHFSGHASRKGLVFENEQGGFDIIQIAKLASVMERGTDNGLSYLMLVQQPNSLTALQMLLDASLQ